MWTVVFHCNSWPFILWFFFWEPQLSLLNFGILHCIISSLCHRISLLSWKKMQSFNVNCTYFSHFVLVFLSSYKNISQNMVESENYSLWYLFLLLDLISECLSGLTEVWNNFEVLGCSTLWNCGSRRLPMNHPNPPGMNRIHDMRTPKFRHLDVSVT